MRKLTVFALVPLLLFSFAPISQHDFTEIGEFNPAYRSASQPAPFVLDSFESLNASDDSVVMSLDERNGKLAGCAQFSGTLNGLNQPGGTGAPSNGGDDVVLFGWSTASGYWSTVFGGTGTDVCNRVKWMDNSQVGVAGSFEHGINLGGDSHSSLGGKDAYFESTTQPPSSGSIRCRSEQPAPMNFGPLHRSQTVPLRWLGPLEGTCRHQCRP